MRVTNGNMMSGYLRNIQTNLQGMNKLSTQLNTSKQVNNVSDDPLKAIKIMNLNNEISDVEKYNANCDELTGWLDMTDSALDQIGTLTSEIKTLLTSISGAYGKDEIGAVRAEVNEKIKQIGEALNTTYAGKYIFGGTATDEAPVQVITNDDGTVSIGLKNTDMDALNGSLSTSISNGIKIDYNLTITNATGSGEAFDMLNELSSALNGDTVDMEKINELSGKIDSYLSDILNNRSMVGAKTNTVNKIKDINDENALEMKSVLSSAQDVDYAEKFIEYQEAQMVYTASLQVSSKLFSTTILDYIR